MTTRPAIALLATVLSVAAPACAPETTSGQPAPAASLDDGLADRLMETVRALSDDALEGRRAGSEGAERAREILVGELERAGVGPLAPGFARTFPLDGEVGTNLVGVVEGRRLADRMLLLGAHYDHLGVRGGEIYNGADDNASGVAVALEIARRVAEDPLAHTLVVALFDAEEQGLRGSRAYVEDPPAPLDRLRLMVNLDMVARGEEGGLFASGTHHAPALRPVLEAASAGAPLALRFGHDQPGTGPDDWTFQSDHASFHRASIPFVYFGVEDHPDYHRPTDDWDRIDPRFLAAAALTVERSLRALDEALAAGLDPREPAGGL